MNPKTTNILVFSIIALVLLFIIPLIAVVVIYAVTTGIESSVGTFDSIISLGSYELEILSEAKI